MRSFSPNDAVSIKNHSSCQTCIPGTVIEQKGLLSYTTVIPYGEWIVCHIDETQEKSTIPAASSAAPSSSNTPIKPSDPPAQIEISKKSPDVSHQN
ncbi:hypothetical protein AVEN_196670-1 [Araneus ventricosus]|uniref:Uncharacterized protein n=1 Tax=Araneus ventricosus TaxID=182803 RepID=A0A4Y2VHG0_ARAVE|nr:hypothetical protein AVEN_196670-1 [Araneus ventricosus]